jgi:mycofactocin system transcriptional regulator
MAPSAGSDVRHTNGTECRKEGGGVPQSPGSASATAGPRVGRRPTTSRGELERTALQLFVTRGFEETTVEDIAAAAGISRRTFFRYYNSKNDVVWGDFEAELQRMRSWLADHPSDAPMMDALREAIIAFNHLDSTQVAAHRQRMTLILQVPALQAHSTLRYAGWRAVVAEYAARRLRLPETALLPQTIAYTFLGAAIAAYEHWLRDDHSDLDLHLDQALRALASGFQDLRDP